MIGRCLSPRDKLINDSWIVICDPVPGRPPAPRASVTAKPIKLILLIVVAQLNSLFNVNIVRG